MCLCVEPIELEAYCLVDMILNKLRGNAELNSALSLSPIIEAYPYSTSSYGF